MLIVYKVVLIITPVIGIILLVIGIKMLIKSFNEKIIVEIPFTCKVNSFQIGKAGAYSIWQKGKLFRKAPVDKFRPVITNETTGEQINISTSIMGTHVNNGSIERMKLFTFSAQTGNFKLELAEGSSVSFIERAFSSLIPVKKMDPDQYFIQIRENQPGYLILLGIPLIIIGFAGVLVGIILFATFDQWINNIR